MDDPLVEMARTRLGVSYLYPIQRFVISNTLEGASQIVILPTGAGKSLCFQLPSLLLPRTTLVLVPLLSLMADQLRKLQQAGVPGAVLRGGIEQEEKKKLFAAARAAKIRVLLATPEACLVASNRTELRSCKFSHLVVDEAHCVSEWGESFRPAYLQLGSLARDLGISVRTAFTATASQTVIDKIKELIFDDREVRVVAAAPDRPNIFYAVTPVLSLNHSVEELVKTSARPLLAFFRTRSGVEVASRFVRRQLSDTRVRFYHAGLSREERAEVEKWFLASSDGALFATCAYGMGVDKPDIRTVVHAGVPSSVEAYLQETGRAGRDGKPSVATLLLSEEDRGLPFGPADGVAKQRYQTILGYALSHGSCRRETLLRLIGAEPVACSGCDVCAGTALTTAPGEREILQFAARSPRSFAASQVAEILTGSRGPRAIRGFHDCVSGYNSLGGWDKAHVEEAIRALVRRGSLSVVKHGPWKRTLTRARQARRPPEHPEARS
ncbi:MAG TPA: RecQ family ATP-dependent DNA helicase [Spirochaetia bacterium]|nr:RecQ family ATP-dependent DNA helicase [Spirochaetia bacterium]